MTTAAWDVQLLPRAQKALRKLDRPTAKRIRDSLMTLAERQDPTEACKALSGPMKGLWRYRIGNYRVILDVRRSELTIVAIDLGHRSTIYL